MPRICTECQNEIPDGSIAWGPMQAPRCMSCNRTRNNNRDAHEAEIRERVNLDDQPGNNGSKTLKERELRG